MLNKLVLVDETFPRIKISFSFYLFTTQHQDTQYEINVSWYLPILLFFVYMNLYAKALRVSTLC
jgi:hypothetical protein